MTPDQAKALIDMYAVAIMLVWGTLCKFVPILAKIPNSTIGWVNLVGYVLTKFLIPDAHAAIDSPVNNTLGIITAGIANSSIAFVIYETLLRSLWTWLKLKKAEPKSKTVSA